MSYSKYHKKRDSVVESLFIHPRKLQDRRSRYTVITVKNTFPCAGILKNILKLAKKMEGDYSGKKEEKHQYLESIVNYS